MLLENAALAQHCGVVQGMLLDEVRGSGMVERARPRVCVFSQSQAATRAVQLEKTLLTMLECLQRMEHYRQRL